MARYDMSIVKVAKALYMADKNMRKAILDGAEISLVNKYDTYDRVWVELEVINIEGKYYGKINQLAKEWRNSGCGWGRLDYSVFAGVKGAEKLGLY